MKRLINLQKYWVGEIYVRMSTRKFVSLYYDRMNGLRNGYILQIIGLSFVFRICSTFTLYIIILLVASTVIIPTIVAQPSFAQLAAPKEKIILTAMFVQLHTNREMGKFLLDSALVKLKMIYPNLDIQLKYLEYPSNQIRFQALKALNHTTGLSIN